MPEKIENGRKYDGKKSLQDFDAKEMYLHHKNRPALFVPKALKNVFFIILKCAHHPFHFQNVPVKSSVILFLKSDGKIAIFV